MAPWNKALFTLEGVFKQTRLSKGERNPSPACHPAKITTILLLLPAQIQDGKVKRIFWCHFRPSRETKGIFNYEKLFFFLPKMCFYSETKQKCICEARMSKMTRSYIFLPLFITDLCTFTLKLWKNSCFSVYESIEVGLSGPSVIIIVTSFSGGARRARGSRSGWSYWNSWLAWRAWSWWLKRFKGRKSKLS